MAVKCLVQLPEELQGIIIDYLIVPTDQKHARLVCTKLEPAASAGFYRDVKIDLRCWEHHPLYRLGRKACRYVRRLEFTYPDVHREVPTDLATVQRIQEGIKELLQLLPHGLLKSFRSSTYLPLDRQTMLLLAATQRNLVKVTFGKIHDAYLALPDTLKPWPAALTLLDTTGLYGDEHDFAGYRKMIHESRNLKEIVLRAIRPNESMPERPSWSFWDMMQDSYRDDGLFSRILQKPGQSREKMKLSSLALDEIDLYYCDRTFTKHVDFSQLRVLDLFRCPGAAMLLRVLTPYFQEHGSCLKGFTLWVERPDEPQLVAFETEVLLAFMDCLERMEYFTLDAWALTSPMRLTNMRKIAMTLKRLYIGTGIMVTGDRRPPPYYVYPLAEVRDMCERCPELVELAVALPAVDTFDSSSAGAGFYSQYLSLFSSLPKLKFFRSLTWPTVPSECLYLWGPLKRKRVNKPIFDDIMTNFAKRLAEMLFESSPIARLNLLSIGDRDPSFSTASGLDYGANPRAYLVRRHPALDAHPLEVVLVKLALIKYHVPDCSEWHRPEDAYDEPAEIESMR